MTEADQSSLDRDRRLRVAVYEHFREMARAPTLAELARKLSQSPEAVLGSLRRLAEEHALVLAPESGEIWMAHPFSGVPTAHQVEARSKTYFANCAWDALAIPSFLDAAASCTTACADCGEPISWQVEQDGTLHAPGAVVHFTVPARRFWEDIGFT